MKGQYTACLIVNDTKVDSDPDCLILTVVNARPVADAGIDRNIFADDPITLDGSGSNDADDGDTLTYSWTLIPPEGKQCSTFRCGYF